MHPYIVNAIRPVSGIVLIGISALIAPMALMAFAMSYDSPNRKFNLGMTVMRILVVGVPLSIFAGGVYLVSTFTRDLIW